jgi:DNA replication protein DnaC
MFNLDTSPDTCPGCGGECESVTFGGVKRFMCEPCSAADKARRVSEARRMECLDLWREITPVDFQARLDPSLLHKSLVPALSLDGSEGAGFIGTTRAGKTRVAYYLLKKAAHALKKPYAITASRYRQAAADKFSNDGVAREILQACRFAQALLLDDVGKGSTTEGGDEALYELLTERRDNRRVTFWTANGDGKWIAARYGPDRGPAIATRLANLAGCCGPGTGRIFKIQQPPKQ